MLSDLSAFDLLTDAYLVLDDNFKIVAANEQYCALTCQTPDNLVGQNVFSIHLHGSESARERRERMLSAIFARLQSVPTAESQPLKYPLPGTSDESEDRYWKVFASKRKITDESGRAQARYILRLQDVTSVYLDELAQRKERALLRSTAQLRQRLVAEAQLKSEQDNEALKEALAFAKIGAWTLDLATGIIECTAQCKANYGMPADYLMTHHSLINELIHAEDRPRVQSLIEQAVARRDAFEVEYRTLWPTGETRWVMVRGKFPESDDGTSTRLSGFSLDITERKKVELESVEQMRKEADARRISEDRVNAIDTFVSAVSHELRSPLNAIGSWAQLLDRPDQIALPRAAEVIRRNVRQLSLMIEDLLDTGAAINDKFHVALEPIDLADIARSVAEDARLNIEAKNLTLKSEIETACPILGDEKRLRQVFFNLLTNAVKFTDEGHISVSLVHNDTSARFFVTDTGMGIAHEKQAKIFDRFNQATDIGARRGGLGLGLWIANTIVKAHHGTLSVKSEGVGHGTTFVVELPRTPV